MRKTHELPQKNCVTCGKSFMWRKKWEQTWNEIKYCSDKCMKNRVRPGDVPKGG